VAATVVRDGDALLVVSQHSELKQWWRNLRGGAPVAVHLRGHRLSGRANVIEEPDAVATEVERLIAQLGAKEASRQLYMALDRAPPHAGATRSGAQGCRDRPHHPHTTSGSTTPNQHQV
jgi:hypothetical protein